MSVPLSLNEYDQATMRYLDFGGILRPTMGGPDQRLNRLGNRYAVDIQIGTLRSDAEGRVLRQQIIRALSQGALILLPQDGSTTPTSGTPRVNGAGQTGAAINLDGFTPGYVALAGQPFSIIVGGRRYLYTVNADQSADGSGVMAGLSITPMIRLSPADNAVAEFDTPVMEGFITGDVSWVYSPGLLQDQTVTIEEAA